jgi:hypothetical protein
MDKKKVNVEPRNVVREGQGTIGEGTRGSEKEQWEGRTRNWKRKGQRTMLGRDEEQWEEGQGEVLGKDTEQWEQVVWNSGTRNSGREG